MMLGLVDSAWTRVPNDVPPGSAARMLLALMDGLQVQWLLDEDTDMHAEIRRFVQAIVTVDVP